MSEKPVKSPRIGVLAVQGDFARHKDALRDVGVEDIPWVRRPEALAGLDGLVMPGGESTAMIRLLKLGGLWPALAEFGRTKPIFATCAGVILIAGKVVSPEQESLGLMDITVSRNAYGSQRDSFEDRVPSALGEDPLSLIFIRAPRILAVGPDCEVLARQGGDPILVRQGRYLAATFHPELCEDRQVQRYFLGMVRSPS